MLTKELISKLFNQNILVFDNDAKYAELTRDLLVLMKYHAKNYFKIKIKYFYINKELCDDIDFNKLKKYKNNILYYNEELQKYYEYIGGTVQSRDRFLIIGVNENYTDGILGSC